MGEKKNLVKTKCCHARAAKAWWDYGQLSFPYFLSRLSQAKHRCTLSVYIFSRYFNQGIVKIRGLSWVCACRVKGNKGFGQDRTVCNDWQGEGCYVKCKNTPSSNNVKIKHEKKFTTWNAFCYNLFNRNCCNDTPRCTNILLSLHIHIVLKVWLETRYVV